MLFVTSPNNELNSYEKCLKLTLSKTFISTGLDTDPPLGNQSSTKLVHGMAKALTWS